MFKGLMCIALVALMVACGGGGGSGSSERSSGQTNMSSSSSSITKNINDTGIRWGGNYPSGNNTTCIGESIDQQDCSYGRDTTQLNAGDGRAGFSFTKLDNNGVALSASAGTWDCVMDNFTGLIWEVKADDGGFRDKDWIYMNTTNTIGYDPRSDNDFGSCPESDNNSDGIFCHTEGYRELVNAQTLCGANDWRLPTTNELMGLVDYSRVNPAIDLDYFPNGPAFVWSGSPGAASWGSAWCVSFLSGYASSCSRSVGGASVRLVRSRS